MRVRSPVSPSTVHVLLPLLYFILGEKSMNNFTHGEKSAHQPKGKCADRAEL
jgi:hypothetical protein